MVRTFSSYLLTLFAAFLVRHKVKELIEFIQDDDRIREERKKAKSNRDKYVGVGSDTSSRYSKIQFRRILIVVIFVFQVIDGMIMMIRVVLERRILRN